MPRGAKREKELQRKKRLDEKRRRLASRDDERQATRTAAAQAGGPRCEFCGGPLVTPEDEAPADLSYGGHSICRTCYESVPQPE